MSKRKEKIEEAPKTANVLEVVNFCRHHNLNAEMVGKWVWVSFEEDPGEQVCQALLEFGFRFSPRRGKWAHNCGTPSQSAYQSDPFRKYPRKIISPIERAKTSCAVV